MNQANLPYTTRAGDVYDGMVQDYGARKANLLISYAKRRLLSMKPDTVLIELISAGMPGSVAKALLQSIRLREL